MAAGTIVTLNYLDGEMILSQVLYSGVIYIGTNKGKVYIFTISGAVLTAAALANLIDQEITAIATDNTYLYAGTNKGEIKKIKISDGVVTVAPVARLGAKVISLSFASNVLYAGLEGTAKLISVTTA